MTEDLLKKWEQIVEQVDKDQIPVECIKKIVFKLTGGRQKTINFRTLKNQSLSITEINDVVERWIEENQLDIQNMEFILDIQVIANLLQPETDKLLKGI
jgi:hypothetical protein